MAGREADSQQETQKKAKAKQTDRRQVYSSRFVGDEYFLGGVLWKQRRLLTVEYVTNNFSRRYTTQK